MVKLWIIYLLVLVPLEGRQIKSNVGMVYGGMYSDWKTRKGYDVEENIKSVNTSDETSD